MVRNIQQTVGGIMICKGCLLYVELVDVAQRDVGLSRKETLGFLVDVLVVVVFEDSLEYQLWHFLLHL